MIDSLSLQEIATPAVSFLVDLEPGIHALLRKSDAQSVFGRCSCHLTLQLIGSCDVQIAAEFLLSHFEARG